MIPDMINPFFSSVVHGAEVTAKENGYFTFLFSTASKAEAEQSTAAKLMESMADGILLITANSVKSIHRHFTKPLVMVDRYVEGSECDGLVVDNFGGAYEAARYLLEKGHRRIAIINGPGDFNIGQDRLAGFERALAEDGISLPDEYKRSGDWYEEDGHRGAMDLLRLPKPPTAIFAANNLICIGTLLALRERGLKVGKDISLVGFDDNVLARYNDPRISVVERPTEEMGRVGVNMLLDKIEHGRRAKDRPMQLMTLGTKLIRTASVSEPRPRH
jgi:LacI family transcriptional regulator